MQTEGELGPTREAILDSTLKDLRELRKNSSQQIHGLQEDINIIYKSRVEEAEE